MDANEAFSSPSSPSLYNFSQQRQFYLAVDRPQFKMETLMELLDMAGRRNGLPMVVCCSTRDELDAVCSTFANPNIISMAALYSDLAETERALVLEKFRQATTRWNQQALAGDDAEVEEKEERKSHMIVVTDACLPLVGSGESPLGARLLINYELPSKKETYMRRMGTCLATDGIVINMVAGGEVVTLKSIEESTGFLTAEMPINAHANNIIPDRMIKSNFIWSFFLGGFNIFGVANGFLRCYEAIMLLGLQENMEEESIVLLYLEVLTGPTVYLYISRNSLNLKGQANIAADGTCNLLHIILECIGMPNMVSLARTERR